MGNVTMMTTTMIVIEGLCNEIALLPRAATTTPSSIWYSSGGRPFQQAGYMTVTRNTATTIAATQDHYGRH